ncbi:fungal-specific transcription factor domain-containing protein [Aspergillus falconensis]
MRSPLPTRVSSACERCRRHKTRCDPFRPCSLCVRAQVHCRPLPISRPRRDTARISKSAPRRQSASSPAVPATHGPGTPSQHAERDRDEHHTDGPDPSRRIEYGEAESTMGIAQKIVRLDRQLIDEHATSAIPGYQASTNISNRRTAAIGQRLPISSVLGQALPSTEIIYSLLEDYFDAVHWFSLAIYEPTFRRNLNSIADGLAYSSQKPFLILLAVVLGMGAWYRSQKEPRELTDNDDWRRMSTELLKLVESHLIELMDQPSVTAAQVLILFGSYCVYHGRPNLSFSILGATIRISQAVGLHREPSRGTFEDNEERKRVWWTIYTWDRFASITYGRPLGINDRDCNISSPADTWENPYFVAPLAEQGHTICYSAYQRELNRLYLMASSALEVIFGSRTSGSSKDLAGDAYHALVKEATRKLHRWRDELPDNLTLNLEEDFQPDNGPSARAHALQSLSLQLTYDNILIVLHRPLLARQVDHLSTDHSTPGGRGEVDPDNGRFNDLSQPQTDSPFEALSPGSSVASSVHWWNAALRTSRVTELPVLAQLATDSHLVAFLAINLFNAAVVLAVMALSDPLSDTAQVVKRTITRILRLQDLLGRRSALSKQSTTILKRVVTLLLRRESEAILAPITENTRDDVQQTYQGSGHMSVEDTLRLPLDVSLEPSNTHTGRQAWPDLATVIRLNESLTSVQHVVPSSNDTLPSDLYAGADSHLTDATTQEHIRRTHVWPPSSEPEWDLANIRSNEPCGSAGDTNGDQGLYWLWDMSWNGASI